jgi:6-phosphofructokinase 1
VIRSIVLLLKFGYGVQRVLGFRYGYSGVAKGSAHEPIALNQEVVDRIHLHGGTLLGSSRGTPTTAQLVDGLVEHGVSALFAIGGDGTLRGVSALCREIDQRGLDIAVVGVPKTIDNDLLWVEPSFGFTTAVDEACRAIEAAHSEARGAWNGIGLVKLMGRHSGFIAAHATLANSDVNVCLVPEVPFRLDGPNGFLAALERRIIDRHHAVVVVAEGAALDMLQRSSRIEHDASGNVKLADIGRFLRDHIRDYFEGRRIPSTVKYIDPSYMVRSLAANAVDSEYCLLLGQHAVHAAMAGRTHVMIGYLNQHFTHVPVPLAVADRKRLDPHGHVWQAVLEATGQSEMCG